MFDVIDVIVQAHHIMDIFEIIAFVGTEMLFAVRPLGDDMKDQIIRRPLPCSLVQVIQIAIGAPN